VDPYRSAGMIAGRPCPRCPHLVLMARPVGDVEVDECARCRGVFVAAPVLDRIRKDLLLRAAVHETFPGGAVEEPLSVNPLRCPRCRIAMKRQRFAPGSDVTVDVCGPHGTWFDERELPAIVAFVGTERARRTRQPPPTPRSPAPETTDDDDDDGGGLLRGIANLIYWWL